MFKLMDKTKLTIFAHKISLSGSMSCSTNISMEILLAAIFKMPKAVDTLKSIVRTNDIVY